MKSETRKLPKGHSYPFKPSFLAAALERAEINIDIQFIRSPSRRLFAADFWPANRNVSYERLYICAGSVPVERAASARRWAEETAIPQLIQWIAAILAADPKSPIRREEQSIRLALPE